MLKTLESLVKDVEFYRDINMRGNKFVYKNIENSEKIAKELRKKGIICETEGKKITIYLD